MLAFKNTTYDKDAALKIAQYHQDADKFVQGTYWDNGRGCSVGCMVHAKKGSMGWHEATEPLYGIPRSLSRIQDAIFERLPIEDAKDWTVKFFAAIPAGADLKNVMPKFLIWQMTDPYGFRKYAKPLTLDAINAVADLYQRKVDGEDISLAQWEAVREQARSARRAAYAAAYAAADAAAAAAVYAAAYDAAAAAYADADAAAYAAYAAAAAAAAYADADADATAAAHADAYAAAAAYAYADAYAARKAYWKKSSEKLLELLAEAPVNVTK